MVEFMAEMDYDFKNLNYAVQIKHPEEEGHYYLCLIFSDGASITRVNRSFETDIRDFIIPKLRSQSTNWPIYSASGTLSYSFTGPYNLILESKDMVESDVEDRIEFIKESVKDVLNRLEAMRSRW